MAILGAIAVGVAVNVGSNLINGAINGDSGGGGGAAPKAPDQNMGISDFGAKSTSVPQMKDSIPAVAYDPGAAAQKWSQLFQSAMQYK